MGNDRAPAHARLSAMPGSMTAIESLPARCQRALNEFLALRRTELTTIAADLDGMMSILDGLLTGGKRLRPAFCYWAWRGAGGADNEEIVRAAAALELLQASALIHDDVMDGSNTRRGRPAAHRGFAALHGEALWRGSANRFGAGAAILLGDLCLSWSLQMYEASGLPEEALACGRPYFDVMRTELMCGQYLDLVEQARGRSSTASALRVTRFKSAKYTIERPLHLGAALAGRVDLVDGLTGYGLPLGIAFQLRDDVLGVFGDPARTGKPAGDDLREGKRTVLVASAMERADPGQAETLERLLGRSDLDAASVDELREVIVDTGALAACETLIARYTDEAVTALRAMPVDEAAQRALLDLANAATVRHR